MKVCVIGLRGFPLVEGGVEKHCECLYPLMREDIELTVFRRKPYVNSEASYEHITFIDLPSTKIKGFEAVFHSYLATRRAIKIKPDVVHIHNIGPSLFSGMLAKRGIPVVVTYHSPNYEHSKWGTLAKKLLLYSEKVAFQNSTHVIFVNRFQREKYSEDILRKSSYIPNGISEPARTSDIQYLQHLDIKPNKYILAVGRITPEKGFDTLIRAFNSARRDGYKLVIAGGVEFESGYMNQLKEIAGSDVVFTGYVHGEKLAQLYTNAALYILSSNNEGFPLVLLEAMSHGLDVLASDIPGAHLVNLDEDDYFPRGNAGILAEKMSRRIASPRKRKYDLSGFNWNTVAEKTAQVFDMSAQSHEWSM